MVVAIVTILIFVFFFIKYFYDENIRNEKKAKEYSDELEALFWDYNRLRKQLGLEEIHLFAWEEYYRSSQYNEDRLAKYRNLKP